MADRTCIHCGTAFAPAHGNMKYCSRACCRRAWRKSEKTKATRRSVGQQTYQGPMVEALLLLRGSACGVCGQPLDNRPTIDHITPRSAGGKHELANLQLAHRSCNCSKGDRVL